MQLHFVLSFIDYVTLPKMKHVHDESMFNLMQPLCSYMK